jgi:inhibitor of KinA sporulation pathway (predicted exonuclease)
MKVLTLDCEYNQPSKKLINIGAAVFDARSAELIETLDLYINPNEPINPEIIDLTGITDSDVKNGLTPFQAYEELKRFHKKHKCFMNPLVWGSSTSNDSHHIWTESQSTEENFMGFRVLDVKTIYQSWKLFENKQIKSSLKEACERCGLSFEGIPHRALPDAINTFRIWYFLVKKISLGARSV